MSRILIRGCEAVAVMDAAGTEVAGGSILVEDGEITEILRGAPEVPAGTEVVDGKGLVALPGLVNTHHHLYQSLTRTWAQDAGLFDWLRELYPIWALLDADWVRAAALLGLAELALSGCSTAADHHYVFPAGTAGLLEAEIEAARQIGVRIHASRGSMDLGASAGGLPPDRVVEDADAVLAHSESVIHRHHDRLPGAMVRIAIGPCSPFSASETLMRESVHLARQEGVRLHTHIAETADEDEFCRERFGRGPVELLDDLGFLGPDVWLAHCVHLAGSDIERFAQTGTGVAWCPTSNLRLGSGIAPAGRLLEAGVAVGLAVDGSASNDGGDLLGEARLGMLAARGQGGPGAMTARTALRLATKGGAACLGRSDLGSLEPGKRADVALFAVDDLAHAGASDPVASLVLCAPRRVRHLLVEGRWTVRDGRLTGGDEAEIAARAGELASRLRRHEVVA